MRAPGLLLCLLLGLPLLGRCSGSQVGQDPCEGRECGTHEGKDCGACPLPTEVCTEAGQCLDLCEGRECGPVSGGSCGTCPGATEICDDQTGLCQDVCEGRECGEPLSGIFCGTCQAPELCGLPGRCFVPGTCPPDMVEMGLTGVCIDPHEVTCARMAELLEENDNDCWRDDLHDWNGYYFCVSLDTGHCLFKEDDRWLVEPGMERYPVTEVTYGGALSACEAWGRRLCKLEEWSLACEGPDSLNYPYGDTYDPFACNACIDDMDPNCPYPRTPVEVGSFPGCEGGYPGLFDMIGNVSEWMGDPSADEYGYWYFAYGGGPSATSGSVCRDEARSNTRNPYWTGKTIGFRCCLTLD